MWQLKTFIPLQRNNNRGAPPTTPSFGKELFGFTFGFLALSILSIFLILEFFFIEPHLKRGVESQGKAMLEFFAQSTRNHLLSGYHEGLNIAAELLIRTSQCDSVNIYNPKGERVASYPTHPLESNEAPLDLRETKNSHLYFSKKLYFEDLTKHPLGTLEIGISKKNLNAQIYHARWAVVIWVLILTISAWVGLKFVIRKKVEDPLFALISILKDFNKYEKILSPTWTSPKHEEFRVIYQEAQKLIQKIQNAQDMIERKGATEAMGELMQDFSHGIRTPLTIIKNSALDIVFDAEKLLATQSKINASEVQNFKQRLSYHKEAILDESNKMETFVSRILDSTQPIDLHPTPTTLYHMIEKVMNLYRVSSESFKKKIIFLNQIDPHLPTLSLDKAYLEEVFDNLISNSIYAIENNDAISEGYIRITAHTEGVNGHSKTIVNVEDNGSGIEAIHLKHIFKPHFTTKKQHGNGRGLYICQRILDKHNATMSVESTPAKGTKMKIHFSKGGGS